VSIRTFYEFIEAPAFSRYRDEYLDDNGFRDVQKAIINNPAAGDLIPGTGGLRKLRWRDNKRGKGKRGGIRIIYYTFLSEGQVWLMTLYSKDEADDLTNEERRKLNAAIQAEKLVRTRKGSR
jgi:hypothetical protein